MINAKSTLVAEEIKNANYVRMQRKETAIEYLLDLNDKRRPKVKAPQLV